MGVLGVQPDSEQISAKNRRQPDNPFPWQISCRVERQAEGAMLTFSEVVFPRQAGKKIRWS
jgi:hypothetical protein